MAVAVAGAVAVAVVAVFVDVVIVAGVDAVAHVLVAESSCSSGSSS